MFVWPRMDWGRGDRPRRPPCRCGVHARPRRPRPRHPRPQPPQDFPYLDYTPPCTHASPRWANTRPSGSLAFGRTPGARPRWTGPGALIARSTAPFKRADFGRWRARSRGAGPWWAGKPVLARDLGQIWPISASGRFFSACFSFSGAVENRSLGLNLLWSFRV